MKDFNLEIELENGILYISNDGSSGVSSVVENEKQVIKCISNYLKMYVFEEEEKEYVVKAIGPSYESKGYFNKDYDYTMKMTKDCFMTFKEATEVCNNVSKIVKNAFVVKH